ncbi:hypothetical protein COT49_00475 [candidate division WWE3 bacterium CG08_land_8_20_14_0_20_40_13]|uniref:Thioredoxin domain-containing protein n=1 Tax=candidate division WWE3 bacterium CG08_land_8_20_14_0_20_40_13 TaxID=1975084 RepID=A0A2H0XED4_UNCKA|nr:MAG: hypothetical protein COT49_00475 [candidate division WWE3 bacterium CG08_land_8_20_14_0_20_40_13]
MSDEQTTQTAQKSKANYLTPMAILLAGVLVAVGLVVKDNPQMLGVKFAKEVTAPTINNPTPTQPDNLEPQQPSIVEVSLGQSPVLGSKDAPVTIVEFADFECPFCKRHALETEPLLKTKYIDTGKVKLVFRNLPLPFHDPAATKEAEAALCVKAQLGDEGYFKFHGKLFENSAGNGQGITDEKLYALATQIGADSAKVKTCVENGDKKQEVLADKTEAGTYGAGGTPTSFIGKSSDTGKIQGEVVVGAQPLSVFEATIEKYLK